MASASTTMAIATSTGSGGTGGAASMLLFDTSFENVAGKYCQGEHPSFTSLTEANCDATAQKSHGQQAATLAARKILVSHGAFEAKTGEVWLSYDLWAPSQPTFTIMMDAWDQGDNPSDPNNPWYNRNPFSLEWRDGWFAMNCRYPMDHNTERRSKQITSPLGKGQWANVVIRYNLDTEQGAFWLRALDASGKPTTTIAVNAPAGTVNCSHYGDRGSFRGLALTNFQLNDGNAVLVYTDRWILGTDVAHMP
jgi:hypothetical protein